VCRITPEPEDPERVSTLELGREFTSFYWRKLGENFTPWAFFAVIGAALGILRLPLRQRTFLYLLFIGFVLAAFLQPVMERTETTIDSWSLQFPYHGYAYLLQSRGGLMGPFQSSSFGVSVSGGHGGVSEVGSAAARLRSLTRIAMTTAPEALR